MAAAKSVSVDDLLASIEAGSAPSLIVVAGDSVLSEPPARRLAQAMAASSGCELSLYRRPADLGAVLNDLRTFSLFDSAKVALVTESAVFAERSQAADLLDDAAEALPLSQEEGLTEKERVAASRLLQVLRLFGVGAAPGPASGGLDALPAWAFAGGQAMRKKRKGRGRGKKQVETLKEDLQQLLDRALEEELTGFADSDSAGLAELLDGGLPEGHALVMAESHVAADHPLVKRLSEVGALHLAGSVEIDRKGAIKGLQAVARELERETGVAIEPRAMQTLAERTLRSSAQRGSRDAIDPESTARLASEYRKLANLAGDGSISASLVEQAVVDRGQEDVWKLLDAVGGGDGRQVLHRLRRTLQGAEDAIATRLSLFSLVADFCRQLSLVHEFLAAGVPAGERNYRRFQSQIAPELQRPLPGGVENPLARLHPFRLFRVYAAASRLRGQPLGRLPWKVLETEQRIKGESGDADVALAELMSSVAGRSPFARWAGAESGTHDA